MNARFLVNGIKFLTLSVFLVVAGDNDSRACMGPHTRYFPSCEVSEPRPEERVTVVYANSATGLSSVTLEDDSTVTEVVDLEVHPADKPHYIVLSSGKAIIWRFGGDVSQVSRVMVLGSQFSGAKRAGVVGVPKERLEFVETDLEQMRSIPFNTCTSAYSACEASANFAIPKADRMRLAGPEPAKRHRVDEFIEEDRATRIRIPSLDWRSKKSEREVGPDPDREWGRHESGRGRHELYGGTGFYETSQTYERGIVQLNADQVASPVQVQPYGSFPGWIGLRELQASGAIVAADQPGFAEVYDRWNETISAPHRNRLDPDFLFSYKVDFLVTKPIKLPAAIEGVSFLVAEKVETPEMRQTSSHLNCLFFTDQREPDESSEPWGDPRCGDSFDTALPAEQRGWQASIAFLESLKQRDPKWDAICRMVSLENDSEFIAVALSEGEAWRAGLTDPSRRQIDVRVDRPGKVALFLENHGGRTDWHITSGDGVEIVSVLVESLWRDKRGNKVHGLPPSVPVTVVDRKPETKECLRFAPPRNAYLGGPVAAYLDESMFVLTGRRLDDLIRRTNDGTWPRATLDPSAQRLVVTVE